MLILIDLDGTLINTVHPTWKPYKDGQDGYSIEPHLAQVPLFPGVREFLASRKAKGDKVVVVSDSHFRYVNPSCKMLGVKGVSLADKPNTSKLYQYLESHPNYKQELDNGDCFVIGDTRLDIELGRQVGAMTIWFFAISDNKEEKDVKKEEYLCKVDNSTLLLKSFAFQICDLILWYRNYLKDNGNVVENATNWEVKDYKAAKIKKGNRFQVDWNHS